MFEIQKKTTYESAIRQVRLLEGMVGEVLENRHWTNYVFYWDFLRAAENITLVSAALMRGWSVLLSRRHLYGRWEDVLIALDEDVSQFKIERWSGRNRTHETFYMCPIEIFTFILNFDPDVIHIAPQEMEDELRGIVKGHQFFWLCK